MATVLAVAAAVLAGGLPALNVTTATAAPAAATAQRFSYTGTAYGTSVTVGSVVRSGPSALVTLGCTSDSTLRRTNATLGLNLAPLAQTGAIFATAATYADPVKSSTSATTAEVSLLNGLVQAKAIKAVSTTTRTATGYDLSAAGTTFTELKIAGSAVRVDVAPNTRINLPGLGYVIVNQQIRGTSYLVVTGLRVVVTSQNLLGIPVGSTVVVSQAVSGLSQPVAGVLGGQSYGTMVYAGGLVFSGPSFPAYMPCLGTGGPVKDNTGVGISLGTLLRSDTITNTVQGTVTATTADGKTTSTVQAVKLLDGVVEASGVKASARATTNGGTPVVSDSGSGFLTLKVAGHPGIRADVAANTKVAIQGVGTLYLHRVIRTSNSIEVRMIELVLSSSVNGLPTGTTIRVAVARAAVS